MSNILVTVSAVLILFFSIACVNFQGTIDQKPTHREQTLSTCKTASKPQIKKGQNIQKQEITIKKVLQVIIRRNCQGKLLSKTLQPLEEAPPSILLNSENLPKNLFSYHRELTNQTTCSQNSETDDKNGSQSMKFSIDMKSNTSHLKVIEGLNYIDYKFYGPCKDEECISNEREIREQGTLILNVTYQESTLNQVKETSACSGVTFSH